MINSIKYENKTLLKGKIYENNKAVNPKALSEKEIEYFLSRATEQMGAFSSCDYKQSIKLAKNDIFFSGVVLSYFDSDLIPAINKIDPNIEINIIVSDTNNKEIVDILNPLFGMLNNNWSAHREVLIKYKGRLTRNSNVNFQFINRFSPISFFAVDVEKESGVSFIQAKLHSIPKSERSEFAYNFYHTVQSGTEMYNFYKSQILILKEEALKTKQGNNQ